MLNLHASGPAAKDQGELYKVLILDRFCKDIVAPLMRVSELRSQGVTLHLLIDSERQPITDVPAVYFVQPTQDNVDKIVADAAASLYDLMYINFATSIPSRLLEQLATGTVVRVCRVGLGLGWGWVRLGWVGLYPLTNHSR